MTRTIVGALVTLSVLVALAGAGRPRQNAAAARHVETFDAVWATVDKHYFDRTFNGMDWPGIRARYRPRAAAAASDLELYWQVLGPMLGLLETSHLTAVPPSGTSGAGAAQAGGGRSMAVVEPSIGRCAGFVISSGLSPVDSRVLAIDPDSTLYKSGVRSGWRLTEMIVSAPQAGRVATKFGAMSPSGEMREFTLHYSHTPEAADLPGAPSVENGSFLLRSRSGEYYAALIKLKASADHPDLAVRYPMFGLVATLGSSPRQMFVSRVIPGSPAERAGVEPGWFVREIHDVAAGGGSRDLRATFATSLGAQREISLRYACVPPSGAIEQPVARSAGPGTLLLKFDHFSADSTKSLIATLSRNRPRRVVLDLRDNGGGSIIAFEELMGVFLPEGSLLGRQRTVSGLQAVRTRPSPWRFEGQLAVLIGPSSASASEVMAAALRYHRRARLFGRRTAGEVVGSNRFDLPDGGVLQVATSDFFGPDGVRLERRGIAPDYEVWETLQTIRAGEDPVLEEALKAFTE